MYTVYTLDNDHMISRSYENYAAAFGTAMVEARKHGGEVDIFIANGKPFVAVSANGEVRSLMNNRKVY